MALIEVFFYELRNDRDWVDFFCEEFLESLVAYVSTARLENFDLQFFDQEAFLLRAKSAG